MKQRLSLVMVLSTILASALIAQTNKVVTNDDVLAMVKAGLQEETMLQAIELNESRFNTSSGALKALRDAGVSERILAAMVGAALPGEVGVHVKRGDQYVELQRESVQWRGSFRLGEMERDRQFTSRVWTARGATAKGRQSAMQLAPPLELLIVSPQGVSASDFGLFRAEEERNPKRERRQFVLHVYIEGPNVRWNDKRKNFVRFGVERIAPRKYRVRLPPLEPGEYAFVPPGPMDGEVRVLYTFGIH